MQVKFPKEVVIEEESFSSKVVKWRTPIVWGVSLSLILTFAIIRLGMRENSNVNSFFKLSSYLSSLKKGESVNRNELSAFKKAHPEIAPLLDHYLIEDYFKAGETESAKKVGKAAMERISYVIAPYREYAMGSLLIEEGAYEKALAHALELDETLASDQKYSKLKLFNLLRIALLEKSLGTVSQERWNAIRECISCENASEVLSHLSREGVDLEEFIDYSLGG